MTEHSIARHPLRDLVDDWERNETLLGETNGT